MKHLKKLSVVLMMTTLFSVSFTSCIDNEVSPLVEAIYEAQADLIAAQAGVQNAEAALLLAQANAVEAQAAAEAQVNADLAAGQLAVLLANAGLTDAQAQAILSAAEGNLAQALADAGYTDAQAAQILADIADQEADAEYMAAVREQQLLALVAQTNLEVSAAENALALAEVTFEAQLQAAIAAMEAAGAQIAVGYAWDYAAAMQHANNLMSQLLGAQADLADAQLMQNGNVSWEYYLAQLEGVVATKMAAKASIEDAIADLEAYIADPTTPESMLTTLKAENDALDALRDAKEIEMQVQYNKIMAIYEENSVRNDVYDRTFDSLNEHNDAVNQKNDRLGWIEDAEDDIADWQLALDDYPTALAALEDAVDAAQDAVDAAQDIYDAAVITQDAANDAQIAADDALTFLEGELAQLYESLQDAADDLASEQSIYDAGIGAATTANANAITAITTAGTNLAAAQANYNLWKTRFEGLPVLNGGYTWMDPGTDLFAPILGIQNPATGTTTPSYVRINLWDAGTAAVDDNFAATYELPVITALPVGANVITYGTILTDSEVAAAYPSVGYTEVYYYRVDADDIAYNNLTELTDAIAALGDEDIFDVPPTLGAMPLVGMDAYTALWNAQLAQLTTQDTLDNFGDNLAAAQAEYDYWKNLYENELDLLDAAQLALDNANAELSDANTELTTATDALSDANSDLSDAEDDLNDFLLCDDECLQANIDAALVNIADWNAQIVLIQPIIDAKYAVVAGLLGELTAAGVEYTFTVEDDGTGTLVITNFGLLSSLYPDLHAEIIAEWQVYWSMEQELDALNFQENLNDEMIDIYGGWSSDDVSDLADDLAGLQQDLADAIDDIEVAEQALAAAQVEEAADEAYIAYLEAIIDTLEQRHANTLAIAAKYKALMEAALAS